MHDVGFLQQTVLIFGSAMFVAWLFRLLRAPAVVGFLVAGILIGPSCLRLISPDNVEQFAELGLVMLLFTVGLELSPQALLQSGTRLIVAASAQVVLIAALALAIAIPYWGYSISGGVVFGVAIALSSTAIVLKQLSDLRQMDSTVGTLITGILLLQDILVLVLMACLPLMAGMGASKLGASAQNVAWWIIGLSVLLLGARKVLPLVLHQIGARGGRELLTLFAVSMACAGAWLAGMAGWSWALGACVAGLLLSETDLRHQLVAEIAPFRDVFNALFFIALGMLVDIPVFLGQAPTIVAAIALTLVLKIILSGGSMLLAGWPLRIGVTVGVGLCTVSEFSYVLVREAARFNILSDRVLELFVPYAVGTMMIGAMIVPYKERIADIIARSSVPEPARRHDPHGSLAEHVIIVGYGLNGQNLARVLKATGIPFCIVEINPGLAAKSRREGYPVILGDATRVVILEHAGLERARALVVAINEPQATRQIVAQAHASRPDLYVLTRTRFVSELETLYRLGAKQVIPEEFETSIEIFTHVLREFMIPQNVIEAQIATIRSGRYGILRGLPFTPAQRRELLTLFEAMTTQTYALEPESPAIGKTIREVDLRAKTAVTIVAVVRRGKPFTNPPADWKFEPGDVLVLVGSHKELDSAGAILSAPPAQV